MGYIVLYGKTAELRSVACRMVLHSVTYHLTQVKALCLNPSQAGWHSIKPIPEVWVGFGVGYMPRWFICPHTVTHLSSNLLIATRIWVELTPTS